MQGSEKNWRYRVKPMRVNLFFHGKRIPTGLLL
jgi:hypothetical protein